MIKYQNRFVSPFSRLPKGGIRVTNEVEVQRWRQYFLDQRARLKVDSELTGNQRKEILEACAAFEWTPERTMLIKEPVE